MSSDAMLGRRAGVGQTEPPGVAHPEPGRVAHAEPPRGGHREPPSGKVAGLLGVEHPTGADCLREITFLSEEGAWRDGGVR
jgi:hypothetical protein